MSCSLPPGKQRVVLELLSISPSLGSPKAVELNNGIKKYHYAFKDALWIPYFWDLVQEVLTLVHADNLQGTDRKSALYISLYPKISRTLKNAQYKLLFYHDNSQAHLGITLSSLLRHVHPLKGQFI
ncbi:hypothetical protein Y1Q_0014388 [Alligator mississippiensis]|uniref:Uncharacterized protein n=1 Tax=Alligator mississippiensis TaxID=8496 RepID=A0A151PCD9_ALLMI|nr:hypothetical protein Y1Q_0014388 [Alligator mississippiensis]